jgi:hypothetical protein
MILIVTALMLEARPVRERMGLEASGNEPYPVFTGDNIILLVSGTGALKASAATAWAMARFPGISMALNLGFAGAAERISPLYQWHYIHAIRDQSNGRLYVPDILLRHAFPERQLLTVGKVVTSDNGWDGLVDMEGSGFYEAARHFIPPDRIALLKWVSDPLSGSINTREVAAHFQEGLGPVIEFINGLPDDEGEADDQRTQQLLKTVNGHLRLSRTQQLFLAKWLNGYISRGGEEARVLACLPQEVPSGKRHNNRCFEVLKDALKG